MSGAIIELVARLGIFLIGWWSKTTEEKEKRNREFMKFLSKLNSKAYDSIKQRDDFKDIMKKIKDEENASKTKSDSE